MPLLMPVTSSHLSCPWYLSTLHNFTSDYAVLSLFLTVGAMAYWHSLSWATSVIVLGVEWEEFLSGVWGSILSSSMLVRVGGDLKASLPTRCRVGGFLPYSPPTSSWEPLSLWQWDTGWEFLYVVPSLKAISMTCHYFPWIGFSPEFSAGTPQAAYDQNRQGLARVWCENQQLKISSSV